MSVTQLRPPIAPTLVIDKAQYVVANGVVFGTMHHLRIIFYKHFILPRLQEQNLRNRLATETKGGIRNIKIGKFTYISLLDLIFEISSNVWQRDISTIMFYEKITNLYNQLCNTAGIQPIHLMTFAGMINSEFFHITTTYMIQVVIV